jgi:cellulose synthase/poly-beta-1,6-N-acetylglucosamine synthase-like glycosyltransferase
MLISLCIPVFGRERMLCQTLHSILLQEYQDFEIIVRDDNPEQPVIKNSEVRQTFEFIGCRLKYHIGEHLGTFSKVANATLAHATGDIRGMMASDDLLAPGALYTINETFESDSFDCAKWIYGKTISTDHHLSFIGIDGTEATLEEMLQSNRIGCPSTFWNRKMQNLAGTFDTRYKWAADYDLWIRFWKQRKPAFVNREIGIFRHHAHQMSQEQSTEIESEAHKISTRHKYLGDVINRARNRYLQQKFYSGDVPLSHDG